MAAAAEVTAGSADRLHERNERNHHVDSRPITAAMCHHGVPQRPRAGGTVLVPEQPQKWIDEFRWMSAQFESFKLRVRVVLCDRTPSTLIREK